MTEQEEQQRLAEIKGRLAALNAGDWKLCPYGLYILNVDGSGAAADFHLEDAPPGAVARKRGVGLDRDTQNGEFIAHSKADVAFLLELLEMRTTERNFRPPITPAEAARRKSSPFVAEYIENALDAHGKGARPDVRALILDKDALVSLMRVFEYAEETAIDDEQNELGLPLLREALSSQGFIDP